MQGPWEAMLTLSDGAKLKDARQNLRMQGYPWESCSSLLCGLTVDKFPLPRGTKCIYHTALLVPPSPLTPLVWWMDSPSLRERAEKG